MAALFLDSSALVKLYHEEAGSAVVEKLVRGATAALLISRLSVVEVQSALAGKVRSRLISAEDAMGLRHRFLEDIAGGLFRVVGLTSDHYHEAGELIGRHGAGRGLRALDSLQLAVALSLHRSNAIEGVVAADKVLCGVAAAEGIHITDPEYAAL